MNRDDAGPDDTAVRGYALRRLAFRTPWGLLALRAVFRVIFAAPCPLAGVLAGLAALLVAPWLLRTLRPALRRALWSVMGGVTVALGPLAGGLSIRVRLSLSRPSASTCAAGGQDEQSGAAIARA